MADVLCATAYFLERQRHWCSCITAVVLFEGVRCVTWTVTAGLAAILGAWIMLLAVDWLAMLARRSMLARWKRRRAEAAPLREEHGADDYERAEFSGSKSWYASEDAWPADGDEQLTRRFEHWRKNH